MVAEIEFFPRESKANRGCGLYKKMQITELKREDEGAWDSYIFESNTSSFYHQIGWRNVVGKTYKHKPVYLIVKETFTTHGDSHEHEKGWL